MDWCAKSLRRAVSMRLNTGRAAAMQTWTNGKILAYRALRTDGFSRNAKMVARPIQVVTRAPSALRWGDWSVSATVKSLILNEQARTLAPTPG